MSWRACAGVAGGIVILIGVAAFLGSKQAGKSKESSAEIVRSRLSPQVKSQLYGKLQRPILLETTAAHEALAVSAARMQAGELKEAIREQSDDQLAKNPWPVTAYLLASRWKKTGDPEAGKLAARILADLAENPGPPPKQDFHVWENIISEPAVQAFGLLDAAAVNPPLTSEQRHSIIDWFRLGHQRFREVSEASPELSNLTPYALRTLLAAAVACDDREMAQTVGQSLQRLYSPKYFLSDGTWYEGAASYMQQTIGNVAPVIEALRAFNEGPKEMNDSTVPLAELQRRQEFFQRALDRMQFPNGAPLTYGDTHWGKARYAPEKWRYESWQLPDYGLFSIASGTWKVGTAAYLYLPLTARGGRYGGGHQHDDRLAINLWGAGTEALADPGYPVYSEGNYRYFQMSAWPHNVAVATPNTPILNPGGWNRSALLAYDDGEVSGGEIKLLAGSSPGPAQEGIEKAERLISLISTGEGRTYVVDVFRLKGGVAHESFLRPFDDEDASLQCSLPRVATGQDLEQYLQGKPGYLPQYRKLFKNVESIDSARDLHLVWQGKTSGVQVHAWIRSVTGMETLLSRFPRLRPTENQARTRDDFPGWHLYRRRDAQDGKATVFAAVYEICASGAPPLIQDVHWDTTPDPESVAVEITLASGRKDAILAGLPGQPTTMENAEMEGRLAVLIRQPGKPIQSYLYGEGKVIFGGYCHMGTKNFEAPVLEARSEFGSGRAEILVKAKNVPKSGFWGTLRHGDGSGSAFKLSGAHLDNNQVRFETSALGEEIIGDSAKRIAFPLEQSLEPPFRVVVEEPTYQKQNGTER